MLYLFENYILMNNINTLSSLPLYHVWYGMKYRCNNKKASGYNDYGGRGIRVCKKWHDFQEFYRWALDNGYQKGLSIDRINNNGNYRPGNCRFTTRKVQSNNKRPKKVPMGLCINIYEIDSFNDIIDALKSGKRLSTALLNHRLNVK
jgi:hypothetical protein